MSINRLFQVNNPKKFIKEIFKVLCIAGAILTFVFTCYQFTDSILRIEGMMHRNGYKNLLKQEKIYIRYKLRKSI